MLSCDKHLFDSYFEQCLVVQIRIDPVKGRCVHAQRDFMENEFVLEYVGHLTDAATGEARLSEVDPSHGQMGYVFFFDYSSKKLALVN